MIILIGVAAIAALVVGTYTWVHRVHPAQGGIPTGPEPAHERRFSPAAEALGYVGAILILSGGGVAVGRRWNEFGTPGRFSILAAVAAVFLVVGMFVIRSADPAMRRLASVTWTISTAAVTGAAAVALFDGTSLTDGEAAMWMTATATAYAAALWTANPRALQHLAYYAGLNATAATALALAFDDASLWIALTLWAIALGWARLGWQKIARPWWVAVPVACLMALIAPSIAIGDHGWLFLIAIPTAAAMMAPAIAARFLPVLGLGALGLFGYVTGAVVRYFGDSLGVPGALAITGVLVLLVAVWASRIYKDASAATRTAGTTVAPSERTTRPVHRAAS